MGAKLRLSISCILCEDVYDRDIFLGAGVLFCGCLAALQEHCVDKAATYRLETGSGASYHVYQPGGPYPFYVLSRLTSKRSRAAAAL